MQPADKHCNPITFCDSCSTGYVDICKSSHIKSGLPPIKITSSVARIGFKVPRQSVLDHPYKEGWTLSIVRAGTTKEVAAYAIESYNTATEVATFFIDDAIRGSAKGNYVATLMQGCCKVAQALLFLNCNQATAISVQEFTQLGDECTANLVPRAADPCKTACPTPAVSDDCLSERTPCHVS